MKTFITSTILFFSLQLGYTCSCFPISEYFCPTVNWAAPNIEQLPLYIVRAKVDGINGYLMDITVTEQLFGETTDTDLTVIGQDGLNCNQWLDVFEPNQEVILALYGGYQTQHYNLNGCGRFYLHVEEEAVVGPITPDSESMAYTDFRTKVQECLQVTDIDIAHPVKESLSVTPNPCREELQINLSFAPELTGEVYLLDANGSVVKKVKHNVASLTLDISLYPSGLYFVKVVQGNRTFTQKVVKI